MLRTLSVGLENAGDGVRRGYLIIPSVRILWWGEGVFAD